MIRAVVYPQGTSSFSATAPSPSCSPQSILGDQPGCRGHRWSEDRPCRGPCREGGKNGHLSPPSSAKGPLCLSPIASRSAQVGLQEGARWRQVDGGSAGVSGRQISTFKSKLLSLPFATLPSSGPVFSILTCPPPLAMDSHHTEPFAVPCIRFALSPLGFAHAVPSAWNAFPSFLLI